MHEIKNALGSIEIRAQQMEERIISLEDRNLETTQLEEDR